MANAVRVTLGPTGRNVILERKSGAPVVTNEGSTIADDIELGDPYENLGVQLLKEAATRTQEVAGDGTTTATLLAQTIVTQGLLAVTEGANPAQVKRGIDRAVAAVVEELKLQSRPIEDGVARARVARLAAKNDEELGSLVADAFELVGPHGSVTTRAGKVLQSNLISVRGLEIDSGYLSPYFVTDSEAMTAELDNPFLLLHDRKIDELSSFLTVLQAVAEAGRPLVIIAEDVEGEALATLVMNRLRGSLEIAALRLPGSGERRRELLHDLSLFTGGVVVSEETGRRLESLSLTDLGQVDRASIGRDRTTLFGGRGNATEIRAHASQLERDLEATRSHQERERLRLRLSRLAGVIAILEIGGALPLEIEERRGRADDAIAAMRSAAEEGIVAGGGVAFLRAAPVLDGLTAQNESETVGIRIVRRALETPIRTIADNAGYDAGEVVRRVLQAEGGFGFNARTGSYEDFFETGVVDPVRALRAALQNAASIGSLILTTDTLVANKPGPEDPPHEERPE